MTVLFQRNHNIHSLLHIYNPITVTRGDSNRTLSQKPQQALTVSAPLVGQTGQWRLQAPAVSPGEGQSVGVGGTEVAVQG